jgi:hypothetical protein
VRLADARDGVHVGEVHHLGEVRGGEPRRLGVSVDPHHAQSQLACTLDRAALVPPRADEEDRSLHRGRS